MSLKTYKCYICNTMKNAPATCWHTDKDGKEFAVKMRLVGNTDESRAAAPQAKKKTYVMAPKEGC